MLPFMLELSGVHFDYNIGGSPHSQSSRRSMQSQTISEGLSPLVVLCTPLMGTVINVIMNEGPEHHGWLILFLVLR